MTLRAGRRRCALRGNRPEFTMRVGIASPQQAKIFIG
jgi:hypothetical protein